MLAPCSPQLSVKQIIIFGSNEQCSTISITLIINDQATNEPNQDLCAAQQQVAVLPKSARISMLTPP
jgi:hypothetical protein